jgi:WD40 repeat protein
VPILTLKVIETSNQLISLDTEGVVKITDTKRFHGISSFSIEKQQETFTTPGNINSSNLSGFISLDKPLKLVFYGKSISLYEYDKNYNPFAADENFVVGIVYIEDMYCFIIASGNQIKVWSALNGDITKIFIDISEHEITALALDSLKKRMIIGDLEGNVTVHNVLNGARMKHLAKHNTEILALVTFKA